ncbi:hypothetical protein [Sphingomonas sp.]|uniref:hypothetical protein n=1 Tax=Sphingomonas sp. TaxID=28214 RepID=UPI0031D2686C
MFKKIALTVAASTMALSGVAHASAAQSLSLKNVRAATATSNSNEAAGAISPLFIIGGIIGVLVILEVTGAIDIISDDDPDSP